MRRNKPDGKGEHPWKAEVNEDDTGMAPSVISGWYTTVYEPQYDPKNTGEPEPEDE